jgi:translation elongation factor EF-Tu-like GTPase
VGTIRHVDHGKTTLTSCAAQMDGAILVASAT